MKKNRSIHGLSPCVIKMLKIMKLTVFLMLISFIGVFASETYSQTTKLSLKVEKISLEDFLIKIEDQSEFSFFYTGKIDVEKEVSGEFKNKKITEILDSIKEEAGIQYEVLGRQIVLSPIDAENTIKSIQQQKTISGTVTDEQGEPLPGVTVLIKGTTNGTITNMDGNYSIANIPENTTLQFSFVGMLSQEIIVGSQTSINVTMVPDAIGIEEVVAIGYGTQKKADLTGSVSQIKTETLESVPVYNMAEALKMGAAGVKVTQNSGTPGARVEVRIRGGNSMIGNNQPLYVVDGFPVTGGIGFLNPSDIESVDILKDASSTAIYGARGANGVVIITSKKGKYGQKNNIEVNSSYGLQEEINRYDLLDAKEYAIIANEYLKDKGLDPYFVIDDVQNPGTDWQDVIFRTAPIQNHTITFSGSSNKTRYSISGNYFDQEGIIIGSGVKRGSVRINLDQEMNNWLKMGVNVQLSRRERMGVPVDNGARGIGVLSGAASAPPTLPVFDEDGLPTQIEQIYSFGSADMRNPLIYEFRKNRNFANSVLGNTTFDVKITPELSFKTLLGIQYEYVLGDNYTPIIYSNDNGSASISNSYRNSFLNENTLTYKKEINGIHSLNLLGGYTYQSNMSRSSGIGVSGFSNNITENYDLSAAEIVGNPGSGYSEWVLASFLARANYSFKSKYFITASIRADGSSRFGADHKWGYFPSGAFAWRISDESFMKNIDLIDNLKLRVSYGVTGNTALSPYQSLNRLSSSKYIYEDRTDVVGFAPANISNNDLKWESTNQFDIGMDFNILNNRLRFVIDYYNKNTNDLLASVPLPPSMGFGSILKNIGEIQNRGIEFSMDADILRREFKWNASIQISANRNKVIALAGDSDIFSSSAAAGFPPLNMARVGEPLGIFYGYREDGLDEDGFIKYKDLSGANGEPDGVINSFDRVILGNPYPDFEYGVMSNFSYKNFELNIALEGVSGNTIFNATNGTNLNSFARGQNQFQDIMGNYWTTENPNANAKYPKISVASKFTSSDRFFEDGSYLRVRNLKLAYNLPMQKWGVPVFERAQIYISGTNLLTFTNYSGLDPVVNTLGTDSSNIGSRLQIGWDQSGYPSAKTYTVGLRLNF